MLNQGQKVVLTYFAMYYLAPIIGNSLFREHIETIYTVRALHPYAILLLVSSVVLFLLASSSKGIGVSPRGFSAIFGRILAAFGRGYLRYRMIFAGICLPIAFLFVLSGSSGFRYSNLGLSETNSSITVLMTLLSTVVSVDLLYTMFVRPYESMPLLSRRRVENLMLSVVLVITANGTVSMVGALLAFGYAVFPAWVDSHLFMSSATGVGRRLRRTCAAIGICAIMFIVAWLCGETIKKSTSERASGLANAAEVQWNYVLETPELIANYGYYLIASFSSHYYSLLYTAEVPREELGGGEPTALLHPLQSLAFRGDYLLGGLFGVPRPEIGSLMRLNYLLLSIESKISDRAGTSPGLVASFDYAFPFPLNVLACVAYLCWICAMVNRLLSARERETLSEIGVLLMLFSILNLFQSPIDFLIFFDNSTFYLLLLLGISYVPRAENPRSSGAGARQAIGMRKELDYV